MIAFRADGGPSVGMGHIVRSTALAFAFADMGCSILFLSRYKEGIRAIQESGFNAVKLPASAAGEERSYSYGDKGDLEAEAKEVKRHIKGCDVLVMDTYNVTKEYLLELKECVRRLVYIDDLNAFAYPADVLVNGNIGAQDIKYDRYHKDEKLLLGTRYCLLRKEFAQLPGRKINREGKSLLVTAGGADPRGMSIRVTEAVLESSLFYDMKIEVVIGPAFKNTGRLEELERSSKRVRLHRNPASMRELMLCCDVVVSAAGSTLYELCACGTPAVAVIVAQNQEYAAGRMKKAGLVELAGRLEDFSAGDFTGRLSCLCMDYDRRLEMSCRMRKCIDGMGAFHTARSILENL